MEYLLIHGGGRGHHLQYELLYDGGDAHKHLCGLLDPTHLKTTYDYDKRKLGEKERKSVPSQPQVSPKSVPSQPTKNRHLRGVALDLHENAQKMHFSEKDIHHPVVAAPPVVG
jgi:hypothetical protein